MIIVVDIWIHSISDQKIMFCPFRSCALLLSSSSMDLNSDQELECPDPDCTRTFRYQVGIQNLGFEF